MCVFSQEGEEAGLQSRPAALGDRLNAVRFDHTAGFVDAEQSGCVVCLQPGIGLDLIEIPKELQELAGIGSSAHAVFFTDTAFGRLNDGLRFDSGRNVMLYAIQKVGNMRAVVTAEPASHGAARRSKEFPEELVFPTTFSPAPVVSEPIAA